MSEETSIFGKKVIFLNPHSVLDEVLHVLAASEFEVYTTTDHAKLARYIRKNRDCLVFVNVDEGENEQQWRTWIANLRKDFPSGGPGFGVLTMLPDEDKREAYLMNIGVDCGFITMKQGAALAAETMVKMLEANEARGRRRFVRAFCADELADFNCPDEDGILRGTIRDISVAGMSVSFHDGKAPRAGTRLKDLQLSLKGVRVILNGIIIGGRDEALSGTLRVVMFEPASLSDEKRGRIRVFIRRVLQATIETELARA